MNKFDNFNKIVENKYRVKFLKFFKCINNNYINGRIVDKTIWNYSNVILNSLNKDIIFFTNNIVESFNSISNKKLVCFCKTMFNYKRALLEVIALYEMKGPYNEKKISITRAIEHYCKSKT